MSSNVGKAGNNQEKEEKELQRDRREAEMVMLVSIFLSSHLSAKLRLGWSGLPLRERLVDTECV